MFTEQTKKINGMRNAKNQQIFVVSLLIDLKIPKPFTSQALRYLKYLNSQFSQRNMPIRVVL
jgi:hypothetical protein